MPFPQARGRQYRKRGITHAGFFLIAVLGAAIIIGSAGISEISAQSDTYTTATTSSTSTSFTVITIDEGTNGSGVTGDQTVGTSMVDVSFAGALCLQTDCSISLASYGTTDPVSAFPPGVTGVIYLDVRFIGYGAQGTANVTITDPSVGPKTVFFYWDGTSWIQVPGIFTPSDIFTATDVPISALTGTPVAVGASATITTTQTTSVTTPSTTTTKTVEITTKSATTLTSTSSIVSQSGALYFTVSGALAGVVIAGAAWLILRQRAGKTPGRKTTRSARHSQAAPREKPLTG